MLIALDYLRIVKFTEVMKYMAVAKYKKTILELPKKTGECEFHKI